MGSPRLSIVIPAYNESQRIGPTLEKIISYVQSRKESAEIIVVDDGSKDRTSEVVITLTDFHPELRLLQNSENFGKGAAVRRGVLEAKGEWVLFTDADLSAPIEEADLLFETLERQGAAAAVGSRALRRELVGIRQPLFREWAGSCFNFLVRLVTGLKIRDHAVRIKAISP